LATLQPAATAGPRREIDARLSSTNIPAWLPGVIGGLITAALYLAIFLPLRGQWYVADLFADRGYMQYCITLVICWGLSLLALKYVAVKKQLSYAELELELIPLEIGLQITPTNVDQFLGHLDGLTLAERQSILGRRIRGALEHLKSRNSVPEVQEYLAKQADLDASNVDAGYSLLRTFIWVIPLLGFVGTVLGISAAVAGLHTSLGDSGPPAAVRSNDPSAVPAPAAPKGENLLKGLGEVTKGLATAFDATLLALVMAIVLVFPVEGLRKIEYGMLDRIEAFSNDSLLRRMAEERTSLRHEELPEVVRNALDSAFQEHQRWLAQWQAQIAQLGQLIGGDFEAAVSRVQEQIGQTEVTRFQKMEQISRLLSEVFDKAGSATATWQHSQQSMAAQAQTIQQAVAQMQQTLLEQGRIFHEMSQQQRQTSPQYVDGELQNSVAELASQIGRFTRWLDAAESRPRDGQSMAPAASMPPDQSLTMVPSSPATSMSPDQPLTMTLSPPAAAPDEVPLVTDLTPPQARAKLWRRIFNR
jgi:biopolymer transport protein ExbB/TolQ